jgi:hypothetical protein
MAEMDGSVQLDEEITRSNRIPLLANLSKADVLTVVFP